MVSIKVNIFKGITLPYAPRFGKVFGGEFIGQVKMIVVSRKSGHATQANDEGCSLA
ncbi:putative palmitoyl-CoA hydrolase [Helianthus debilis subsp. tardiflorus]